MGLITSIIYHKEIIKRYDDNHIIHYFSYKDFPSLEANPFTCQTKQGFTIKGYIYNYQEYDKEHIIVFSHGIGGGHRSYMREIEYLCKKGFQVIAYDNVGCFESEGKNIRGMEESINDLHTVLNYLKENHYFDNKKLDLIGHSWGGHAISNIPSYYDDINSIACISGYSNYKDYINFYLKGKYKWLQKSLCKFEKKANPDYAESSSLIALKDTNIHTLIIHSEDDQMVGINVGAYYLKNNINNPNIEYLIVKGKKHNPNYTYDAIKYMSESFGTYYKLIKEKKLKSFKDKKAYMDKLDWIKMTEQDEEVFAKIIENIKK